MSNLDAGTVAAIRVYIMPPVATLTTAGTTYTFPLNWSSWVECKRLIPGRSRQVAGGMGEAQFSLLRSQFTDNDPSKPFAYDDARLPIVPGAWVCITAGDAFDEKAMRLLPAQVSWIGFIDSVDGEEIFGTTEMIGTVTALEVGHLLDRLQPRGWSKPGDSNYPVPINSPPSANIAGRTDQEVVGNAIVSTVTVGTTNQSIYLFNNVPSGCSTSASALFTRWRLLRHLIGLCAPGAISAAGGQLPWSIACADASEADDPAFAPSAPRIAPYLNDTSIPEVMQITNVTYKGMLDLLIPKCYGLGWYPRLSADVNGKATMTIYIYVTNDSVDYTLPYFGTSGSPAYAPQTIDLTADPVTKVMRHTSGEDQPDEIIVEGAQIIFGATVCYTDGNLAIGWSAGASGDQQDTFRNGAKNDAGYSSLTDDQKLDRNRAIRQGPACADVFQRFILTASDPASQNGALYRYDTPGTATGAKLPLCPPVLFQYGTNKTLVGKNPDGSADNTTNYSPYLPTATLSRTLPWLVGVDAGGVDRRPGISSPWTVFQKPLLFYYDKTQPTGLQWVDLLAKGSSKRPTPSVDVDDHGPALRITYDKPERLGYNIIDLAADAMYDAGQEQLAEGVNAFDWKKVVATIGIASDQRVKAVRRRPGINNASDVRRSLTIQDPKLQCWVMLKGSVLAVKTDGTPDRLTFPKNDSDHYVTRSDFGLANRMADRLAAWAFRKRTAVSITRMRPDSPPAWAVIGAAIGDVYEAQSNSVTGTPAVKFTSNTVVETVEVQWSGKPRLTVHTGIMAAPNVGGGSSPAAGGPVSVTMSGTVPQAVQGGQASSIAAEAKDVRTPLVLPYNPGSQPTSYQTIRIIGGNMALMGSTIEGIQYAPDPLAALTQVYDPEVDTVYPTGIGRAYLFINGVLQAKKVLVRHNYFGHDLPILAGDVCRVCGTTSLSYSGTAMTFYIFDLV